MKTLHHRPEPLTCRARLNQPAESTKAASQSQALPGLQLPEPPLKLGDQLMVPARSTVPPVLGGPRPAPTIRDKPWPCPRAAGRGLPSQFARVLEMPEPVLGLAPAPPAAGVIFTLFQVKLLWGRGTGDAIISRDISPRGGACWDDAAVPRPAAGDRGCSVPLSPAAVGAAGRWQEPGCSWLQLGLWPLFGAV